MHKSVCARNTLSSCVFHCSNKPSSPLPPLPSLLTVLLPLKVDLLVLTAGGLRRHGDGEVISTGEDGAAGAVATGTQHVVGLLAAPGTLWSAAGREGGREGGRERGRPQPSFMEHESHK